MNTTLWKLKHAELNCDRGWNILLAYLGKTKPDNEPLPMRILVDSLGIFPAIKCLAALDNAESEKIEFQEFLKEAKTPEEITIKFLELFGG